MKTKLAAALVTSICLFGCCIVNVQADDREIDALYEQATRLLSEGRADEVRELFRVAQASRRPGLPPENRAMSVEQRERRERERIEHEQRERRGRELREHQERRPNDEHGDREVREPRQAGHEQIEHIREAAQHLHAAGMHELAEDLMHQAEERQRDLERRGERQFDEGLHRHVEELSKQVRELHERMERMERAILDLSDRGNPRSP